MDEKTPERQDQFPSTMWSVVRLALNAGEPGAERALDDLFRAYQRPVWVYVLSSGCAPGEAEDLTQAFFERLLAKNSLAEAAQTGVKLRAFLITKLQGFLIDQHRRGLAQKRGGGRVGYFADLGEAQARLAEPVDDVTPFLAYQRQWVDTLAANALARLREDYEARGQASLFDAIAPFITQSSEQRISDLSAKLGRPEGTLKSDISRLRGKCQQLIREQVAATLDDPTPANIELELAELMGYRA